MTMDFCPANLVLPYFITNLIGVMLGWILGKWIIFSLRRKMPERTVKRIFIQLVVSILAIFLFVIVYVYVKSFFFDEQDIWLFVTEDPIFKILSGAAIIYVFVLNAIYECFFLFNELSESQLEGEKYKKASAEAQLKNLTNKLNPHFLFNSLNTLAIIIEENKDKAVDFVQELSDVYRYVLNSDKQTWVTLEEEIRFSKSYISLLKMRFESNFDVDISIDNGNLNSYILPLTLQLLIENAIKHNEISDNLHLKLSIHIKDDFLIVGNNINLRKSGNTNSTKMGLTNIVERYQLLTKKEVVIQNTDGQFIVKIPIINLKSAA
jgi:sensor histidine kinase YesM